MNERFAAGVAGRDMHITVPPDPHAMGQVRDRIVAYARDAGMTRQELGDFVTAISEALANAIEHSHTHGEIDLTCRVLDGAVIATVSDGGIGFEPKQEFAAADFPAATDERGRGMSIMRCCTDIFVIESEIGKGTSVLLGRYIDSRIVAARSA